MIKIRAFRAIDDKEACLKFIFGHTNVLANIGVNKVTSSNHDWMYNPAVFVIIVESTDGEKVYGGARIEVASGIAKLPIESATGFMDDQIYALVKEYASMGTGEICGLWNSREVAGMGIGSVFLTRACVTIAEQIGLKSLFALCAPYTVKMAQDVGYSIEYNLGNKGTFYYPKLDLLATAMILKDVDTLSLASEHEHQSIIALRKNLNQTRREQIKNKEVEITFELQIPHLDAWKSSGLLTKMAND